MKTSEIIVWIEDKRSKGFSEKEIYNLFDKLLTNKK
jgi:hypothetical protein